MEQIKERTMRAKEVGDLPNDHEYRENQYRRLVNWLEGLQPVHRRNEVADKKQHADEWQPFGEEGQVRSFVEGGYDRDRE